MQAQHSVVLDKGCINLQHIIWNLKHKPPVVPVLSVEVISLCCYNAVVTNTLNAAQCQWPVSPDSAVNKSWLSRNWCKQEAENKNPYFPVKVCNLIRWPRDKASKIQVQTQTNDTAISLSERMPQRQVHMTANWPYTMYTCRKRHHEDYKGKRQGELGWDWATTPIACHHIPRLFPFSHCMHILDGLSDSAF